jgi:hypothetical protein
MTENKTAEIKTNEIRARIERISHQALDAGEAVLSRLNAPVEQPPVAVARRALSNTLGLWRFCARSHCHRGQCCRGEPLECLRAGLPLLPETQAALAQRKGIRKLAAARLNAVP